MAMTLPGLVQDLLEPELVGLVDHDEEHLIVRVLAVLVALGRLRAKDLVELEVVGVVDVGHGDHVPM
jgi:hypothetical protein